MRVRRLIRPTDRHWLCLVLLAAWLRSRPRALRAVAAVGRTPTGRCTLRMTTWGNDSRLKLTEEAVAAFSGQPRHQGHGGEQRVGLATGTSSPPRLRPTTRPTSSRWTRPTSPRTAAAVRCSTWSTAKSPCSTCRRWMPRCSTPARSDGTLVGAPIGVAQLLGRGQSGAAEEGRRGDAGRQDLDLGRPRHHGLDRSPRSSARKGVVRHGLLRPRRRGDWASGPGRRARRSGPPRARPQSARRHSRATSSTPTSWSTRKATPPAGSQVENTTAALDASRVRHQQGRVPPAVPHPDLGVRRRQRDAS